MKTSVNVDYADNDEVSTQSQDINEQPNKEEEKLKVLQTRKAQNDEMSYYGFIANDHVFDLWKKKQK